jgi:RNA polymerase sigma factor (sigma-70 family)
MLQQTTLNDETAIQLAKKGNPLGQTYLYNAYKSKMVSKYAQRIGRDTAQDIVQNAFISLFKAMQIENKYEKCNFAALLNTSCHNEFVNHYRKDKRNEPIETADYEGISTENGTVDFYQMERIEKAITLLNSSEKAAIRLFAEGYKYEEISEKVLDKEGNKMPLGTIKHSIHMARKKLTKALGEESRLK